MTICAYFDRDSNCKCRNRATVIVKSALATDNGYALFPVCAEHNAQLTHYYGNYVYRKLPVKKP